jgi:hypothetical protein
VPPNRSVRARVPAAKIAVHRFYLYLPSEVRTFGVTKDLNLSPGRSSSTGAYPLSTHPLFSLLSHVGFAPEVWQLDRRRGSGSQSRGVPPHLRSFCSSTTSRKSIGARRRVTPTGFIRGRRGEEVMANCANIEVANRRTLSTPELMPRVVGKCGIDGVQRFEGCLALCK